MPSNWVGLSVLCAVIRGLNAKGLQSLGNSPGLGIVAKAMGIGLGDLAAEAVMAKQGAQSGRSHGAAALAALQGNE